MGGIAAVALVMLHTEPTDIWSAFWAHLPDSSQTAVHDAHISSDTLDVNDLAHISHTLTVARDIASGRHGVTSTTSSCHDEGTLASKLS